MKKIIILIVVATVCLTFCGCIKGERDFDDCYFNEWVSPDGVHYWFRQEGNSFLAPRYDHDGNLVIEEKE